MKSSHFIYLITFSILMSSGSSSAQNQLPTQTALPGNEKAFRPVLSRVDIKEQKAAEGTASKGIEPIVGKGLIDSPNIGDPGDLAISTTVGKSNLKNGMRSMRAELEISYVVDLHGRNVELHCVTPFIKQKGVDDDGNSYRNSGFESVTCGAKTEIYEDEKAGVTASIGLDIQLGPHTIGKGLSGRDSSYHAIVPVTVMKTLDEGRTAFVGTVIMDRNMNGPTQMYYGVGAGRRLTNTTSLNANILSSNTGETTTDLVLAHKKMGADKMYYLRVWRCNGGNPSCAGTGIEAGVEIAFEPTNHAVPAIFGTGKISPEEGIRNALNPRK